MEMYNNALCISPQELTGIVSMEALKKMSQRGTVQQVRRACLGCQVSAVRQNVVGKELHGLAVHFHTLHKWLAFGLLL